MESDHDVADLDDEINMDVPLEMRNQTRPTSPLALLRAIASAESRTNNSTTTTATTTTATGQQDNTNAANSTSGAVGGSSSNNNFVPLTRARMRENLDNQDIVDINNINEDNELTDVAKKARFSTQKLTEDEFAVFNDLINDDKDIFEVYLHIRNRIIQLWFANVQVKLTKEKARGEIIDESQLDSLNQDLKDSMFNRLYEFLDRTGKINFGLLNPHPDQEDLARRHKIDPRSPLVFHAGTHVPPLRKKCLQRVIVLGAGLSGLTAARQLQRFGLDVIVLEARNRVGGRVHTYRKGSFIADLGPSSLNGVVGNPVVVLGKQLELSVIELKQRIPIYENKVDKNGQSICCQVDSLLERAVEREYNKIMEGTRVMKSNYRIEEYQGKPFPVGLAVDWVMKLQEKNIKDDQVKHLKSIESLYKQLIDSANKKLEKAKTIKLLHGQLCSIKDSTDIGNHKDKSAIDTFKRRCLARDLNLAIKEYKLLLQQEEEIHLKISDLTNSPPSDTYLSLSDRRLLDWHFAELEYALGCPINKLGIYYEDDEEIFEGSHWMIVHGFNTIVEAMKNELDIRLNSAVKKLIIGKNHCKVITYQPDNPNAPPVAFTADAVLCTLPLGVLQDSIVVSQQVAANKGGDPKDQHKTAQKGYQPLIFHPPLPKWKSQAISRLGCGNLNKIIMSFDKIFWNHELHLFGVVNHKAIDRGEYFLFWHHGRTPTLTGLISGKAADMIEKLSDVEILERCLTVLRSIYGNGTVPPPKDYVVTKWRKDPWAKGAWSYLQTGSTGADYDTCAEPVFLKSPDGEAFEEESRPTNQPPDRTEETPNPLLKKISLTDHIPPRLFFAGEHTSRIHFASAHGAILTGLREAARIANIYLGCPYDDHGDQTHVVIS